MQKAKRYTRVLSLLICILMLFGTTFGSWSIVYAEESREYLTWTQSDSRWANIKPFGDGDSIGRVGCLHTCLCVLCAASDPSLRDPNIFNPGVTIVGDRTITYSWGALGSGAPIEFMGSSKSYTKNTNISEINEEIKSYIEDGYYVILRCVNKKYSNRHTSLSDYSDVDGTDGSGNNVYPMHYVPVIGIAEDGYPIVWDVSAAGDTYPKAQDGTGTKAHNTDSSNPLLGYIQSLRLLKPKPGYISANLSLADTTEEEVSNASRIAISKGYVMEGDLMGMHPESPLTNGQYRLIFPSREDLSDSDISAIVNIKDNMSAGKNTFTQVLHIVFMWLGLVLLVYAIFLLLAYIFDRVNVFFDFSLLSILSFGTLKIADTSGEHSEIPKGYISNKVFFIRIAVFFGIGLLLISGVIVFFVEKLFANAGW